MDQQARLRTEARLSLPGRLALLAAPIFAGLLACGALLAATGRGEGAARRQHLGEEYWAAVRFTPHSTALYW